ncbi:MAG TPA: hypothetical protein VHW44_23555 [Pseudonocardiaceae bacterium]|nr:hypothetical protein [Pseudonocardiaceae bacterium]
MLTVAVLVPMLGAGPLITNLTSLLLKAGGNRARRITRRTPPTPIGGWRAGRARAAAVGRTTHGPSGPYLAPVSGVECAWYAIQVVRIPARGLPRTTPTRTSCSTSSHRSRPRSPTSRARC